MRIHNVVLYYVYYLCRRSLRRCRHFRFLCRDKLQSECVYSDTHNERTCNTLGGTMPKEWKTVKEKKEYREPPNSEKAFFVRVYIWRMMTTMMMMFYTHLARDIVIFAPKRLMFCAVYIYTQESGYVSLARAFSSFLFTRCVACMHRAITKKILLPIRVYHCRENERNFYSVRCVRADSLRTIYLFICVSILYFLNCVHIHSFIAGDA